MHGIPTVRTHFSYDTAKKKECKRKKIKLYVKGGPGFFIYIILLNYSLYANSNLQVYRHLKRGEMP